MDFDSTRFGHSSITKEIVPFSGIRDITSLPVCPLKFYPDHGRIEEYLVNRGKRFVAHCISKHLFHKGLLFAPASKELSTHEGEIVVDYFRSPKLLVKPKASGELPPYEDKQSEEQAERARNFTMEELSEDKQSDEKSKKPLNFAKEELLTASPVLRGYSLKWKQYGDFTVSGITDIEWAEGALEKLVIEPTTKHVIETAVSSRLSRAERAPGGVVQRKEKGMIILLYGPPGVGKTSTVEAIAQKLKVPL